MNGAPEVANSNCPRCNARFDCCRDAPSGCWCAKLPAAIPVPAETTGESYLCRECLLAEINRRNQSARQSPEKT